MNYRFARKKDLPKVAALLTHSFDGYPFFELYVSDDEERAKFNQAIQRVNTMVNYKHGILIIGEENGQILSAATLESPDAPSIGLVEYLNAGGLKVLEAGGLRNSLGFLSLLSRTAALCHTEYPDAWNLSNLVISDQYQGRGIGSDMLLECLVPFVESHGGSALTLITNSEKNCAFYEKNGFHSFGYETIHVGDKEMKNWSFVRELPQL